MSPTQLLTLALTLTLILILTRAHNGKETIQIIVELFCAGREACCDRSTVPRTFPEPPPVSCDFLFVYPGKQAPTITYTL